MSERVDDGPRVTHADVVVVGAGPAGSATAAHLADAGLDVVVLEKSSFPRDKICGDALTPRAVRELDHLGVDTDPALGWHRNRGLRLVGGGHRMEIDWPGGGGFPAHGLTKTRMGLDETLARHAESRGARLVERVAATEPIIASDGWIAGVRATGTDERGRKVGPEAEFRAPLVVACDGVSSRIAVAHGAQKRDDRPMGVAVRTYHSSPRHDDDYIESWLELREPGGEAMPGYGWLFPLGDGTVNVGLGILDTSPQFGEVNYRTVLDQWLEAMGHEWGIDASTQLVPVRSAALPMAFNRTPHFRDGLLLVGDSAGMVSPFNGEGIDYALEAARIAAEVIDTHRRLPRDRWRAGLQEYPQIVRDRFGGHFTLGRAFAQLIGRPEVMDLGIKYGMGVDVLMRFAVRLLGNIHRDGAEADAIDRIIDALTRAVPATTND
jgi:geranylgeranyl reductase family protein